MKSKFKVSRDTCDKAALLGALLAASGAADLAGTGPLATDGIGLGAMAFVLVANSVVHVELDRRAAKAGQSGTGNAGDGSAAGVANDGADAP